MANFIVKFIVTHIERQPLMKRHVEGFSSRSGWVEITSLFINLIVLANRLKAEGSSTMLVFNQKNCIVGSIPTRPSTVGRPGGLHAISMRLSR